VVAGAFDHRGRARQAHREALAGHAAEEGLAVVAPYSAVLPMMMLSMAAPRKSMLGRTTIAAAGQALAGVVVGVADQVQRDAARQEGAERLAARAFELDADVSSGRPSGWTLVTRPESMAPTCG
jgi:hypothetical protein